MPSAKAKVFAGKIKNRGKAKDFLNEEQRVRKWLRSELEGV